MGRKAGWVHRRKGLVSAPKLPKFPLTALLFLDYGNESGEKMKRNKAKNVQKKKPWSQKTRTSPEREEEKKSIVKRETFWKEFKRVDNGGEEKHSDSLRFSARRQRRVA